MKDDIIFTFDYSKDKTATPTESTPAQSTPENIPNLLWLALGILAIIIIKKT